MKTATQIIEELEPMYRKEPGLFQFNASMYLSGPDKKKTRQELIYTLTGTRPPASKAGLIACVIQMEIKFNQQTLF